MYKRILHPTDFSEASIQSLNQAVALAMCYGAKLEIFHAVVVHNDDKTAVDKSLKKLSDVYENLRPELKPKMEEMVENNDVIQSIISISTKRVFSAGDVIIDKAEESKADLIVMGAHSHRPFRHFFLGSVAETVVSHAPCPVMITGRRCHLYRKFENILLPVDFSDASHEAADVAIAMAKTHRADLHVLHVYQDISPTVHYGHLITMSKSNSEFKSRLEEKLNHFIAEHNPDGVKITPHLNKGRASWSIVDFSNRNSIDLVVIGTPGIRGLRRLWGGSVTDDVLRTSDVSVMAIQTQSNVDIAIGREETFSNDQYSQMNQIRRHSPEVIHHH